MQEGGNTTWYGGFGGVAGVVVFGGKGWFLVLLTGVKPMDGLGLVWA